MNVYDDYRFKFGRKFSLHYFMVQYKCEHQKRTTNKSIST